MVTVRKEIKGLSNTLLLSVQPFTVRELDGFTEKEMLEHQKQYKYAITVRNRSDDIISRVFYKDGEFSKVKQDFTGNVKTMTNEKDSTARERLWKAGKPRQVRAVIDDKAVDRGVI